MPAIMPPDDTIAPEAPAAAPVAPKAVSPFDSTTQSSLATLDRVINGKGDENDRKAVTNIVAQKNAADQEGHINTHTQWGPLVAALLMRQYDKALTYYNGGPTRFEEGRTADNQRIYKEYNQIGPTGVYRDIETKQIVDPKIAKELEDKGVITASDQRALQTAVYQNVGNEYLERATGLRKPLLQAMETSIKTSNIMSQTNNLLAERDRLSQSPALNIISKLSPAQRADLFGFKTGLKTENKGTTKGETESKSGSFTGTQTSNANANFDLTGGLKNATGAGGAAVPPKVGGAFGIGGSTGATNQSTASGNLGAETTATASAGQQQQEDIMSKIQRYTQNAIKTPEEFQAVQRWVQLTQKIHEIQSAIPPEMMAPGSRAIPPESLGLTSGKEATINSLETQRNNALASAWAAFVAKKVRDNKFEGTEAVQREFMDTNTYKGIDYKYDSVIGAVKNGKPHQPKTGDIDVGPNNRPRIFKDGQWEPLNER
jgi:hypothetical protein